MCFPGGGHAALPPKSQSYSFAGFHRKVFDRTTLPVREIYTIVHYGTPSYVGDQSITLVRLDCVSVDVLMICNPSSFNQAKVIIVHTAPLVVQTLSIIVRCGRIKTVNRTLDLSS